MSVRVVKLGGSLLDWPSLPERLRAWLAAQLPAVNVLVVGGGELADAIRRAQHVHGFDDPTAHRACLDVMSVTARLVAGLLPEARLRDDIGAVDRSDFKRLQICDTRRLVLEAGERGELPESWEVTSDSIAAHLAEKLSAEELVLLKSTLPDRAAAPCELAVAEVVDAFFPRAVDRFWAAKNGRVRLVNLRDAQMAEMVIAARPRVARLPR